VASTLYFLKTLGIQCFGKLDSATLLYNSGPGTAYVSDSPNPTSSTAYPIAVGGTLSWDAGRPLYGVSNTTASLLGTSNGGSATDPSAIATALIGQGLPNAIAASISASPVPVKGLTPVSTVSGGALSTAQSVIQGVGNSTVIFMTLPATPGVKYELHNVVMVVGSVGASATSQARMTRSDTNVDIMLSVSTQTARLEGNKDFQGVTLPANVGVLFSVTGTGSSGLSCQGALDVNYSAV
jgi:hypothetical protein